MANHLKTVRQISRLMDNNFSFLGFRFGLDPILGLIPGAGDVVAGLMSVYILWVGWKMNIDQKDMTQMVINVVIDMMLGSVPVLGDAADFFYKANSRNLKILEKYEGIVEGEIVSHSPASRS